MLDWDTTFQQALECYNINGNQEDRDSKDLKILESKGNHEIGGPDIESTSFVKPLKTRK